MMSGRAKVWFFFLAFMLFLPGAQLALAKKKKLPDLVVAGLSGDLTATVGERLQNVVADVLNQGRKPAGAFRIHYYLSPDRTITPDDLDTGATSEVAGLAPGETIRCNTSVDLPASLAPGAYYLGVVVDDQETVAEADESNNVAAFGPVTIKEKDPPPPPASEGIRIDGDPSDWAGIAPVLNDAAGDGPFDSAGRYLPGSDFLHIWVTNDNAYVYFLMEFAGAPYSGGVMLIFDTDVNPSTGCNGAETVIFTSPAEPGAHLALSDYRSCTAADDYPGAVESAVQEHAGHSFVEARVRIEDLFRQAPGRDDIRLYAIANLGAATDVVWSPTVYALTHHYPGGANLQLAFDSPTAPLDFTSSCGRRPPNWRYTMTLTETGGVGVHITSYKTVLYDSNGSYLMTLGANSAADFARLFTACGPASDYIPANGKACGQSLCLDTGGRSGGQIDMTFDGIDDNGNFVRFTTPRLMLGGQ
ncbi:MAG TPA: CARDB domain-containing protein [Blastocatellia bacterium]|nr:CARDB domain-containing protein [Blastocatellia bacterium]